MGTSSIKMRISYFLLLFSLSFPSFYRSRTALKTFFDGEDLIAMQYSIIRPIIICKMHKATDGMFSNDSEVLFASFASNSFNAVLL